MATEVFKAFQEYNPINIRNLYEKKDIFVIYNEQLKELKCNTSTYLLNSSPQNDANIKIYIT